MNKHQHTHITPAPQHGAHGEPQAHTSGILSYLVTFALWLGIASLVFLLTACQPALVKPIAADGTSSYYIDLSKTQSGQPIRYSLAFFVPVIGKDSQSVTNKTDTAPRAYNSATRGQTIISKAIPLPTDYDGLTLQNTTAERRICGAVALCTESKTRHPISLWYSVAHTQKHKGGNHA
ncbi:MULTISPECIES: hypothetical protein [unclassified Psychrobacter]|uniref:hypothetical protein n=1 Tax=unclassified Psychrobacter TaxID=196806 RepID=UPI0018F46CA6|nr:MULTISPECIES: hypothetical protein [unclassified Psychrobacter]